MDATQPVSTSDLWAHAESGSLTGEREFALAPRQTIVLMVRGTPALRHVTLLPDRPARIRGGADGIEQQRADLLIVSATEAWRGTVGRESQKVPWARRQVASSAGATRPCHRDD